MELVQRYRIPDEALFQKCKQKGFHYIINSGAADLFPILLNLIIESLEHPHVRRSSQLLLTSLAPYLQSFPDLSSLLQNLRIFSTKSEILQTLQIPKTIQQLHLISQQFLPKPNLEIQDLFRISSTFNCRILILNEDDSETQINSAKFSCPASINLKRITKNSVSYFVILLKEVPLHICAKSQRISEKIFMFQQQIVRFTSRLKGFETVKEMITSEDLDQKSKKFLIDLALKENYSKNRRSSSAFNLKKETRPASRLSIGGDQEIKNPVEIGPPALKETKSNQLPINSKVKNMQAEKRDLANGPFPKIQIPPFVPKIQGLNPYNPALRDQSKGPNSPFPIKPCAPIKANHPEDLIDHTQSDFSTKVPELKDVKVLHEDEKKARISSYVKKIISEENPSERKSFIGPPPPKLLRPKEPKKIGEINEKREEIKEKKEEIKEKIEEIKEKKEEIKEKNEEIKEKNDEAKDKSDRTQDNRINVQPSPVYISKPPPSLLPKPLKPTPALNPTTPPPPNLLKTIPSQTNSEFKPQSIPSPFPETQEQRFFQMTNNPSPAPLPPRIKAPINTHPNSDLPCPPSLNLNHSKALPVHIFLDAATNIHINSISAKLPKPIEANNQILNLFTTETVNFSTNPLPAIPTLPLPSQMFNPDLPRPGFKGGEVIKVVPPHNENLNEVLPSQSMPLNLSSTPPLLNPPQFLGKDVSDRLIFGEGLAEPRNEHLAFGGINKTEEGKKGEDVSEPKISPKHRIPQSIPWPGDLPPALINYVNLTEIPVEYQAVHRRKPSIPKPETSNEFSLPENTCKDCLNEIDQALMTLSCTCLNCKKCLKASFDLKSCIKCKFPLNQSELSFLSICFP